MIVAINIIMIMVINMSMVMVMDVFMIMVMNVFMIMAMIMTESKKMLILIIMIMSMTPLIHQFLATLLASNVCEFLRDRSKSLFLQST